MGSDTRDPGDFEAAARGSGAVAWVEVGSDASRGVAVEPAVAAHLLRQVTRAVRGGDRVCPATTSLVAVAFGSPAGTVPVDVLGDRIARSVGPALPFDRSATWLATAVGLAGPVDGAGPADPEDEFDAAHQSPA